MTAEYATVCERGHGNYSAETAGTACRLTVPTYCDCCRQRTGERPCPGTYRTVDRSELAPAFAPFHGTGRRIRVRMADGEVLAGYVGRTSGWKPAYLLLARRDSTGSIVLLGAADLPIETADERGRFALTVADLRRRWAGYPDDGAVRWLARTP